MTQTSIEEIKMFCLTNSWVFYTRSCDFDKWDKTKVPAISAKLMDSFPCSCSHNVLTF